MLKRSLGLALALCGLLLVSCETTGGPRGGRNKFSVEPARSQIPNRRPSGAAPNILYADPIKVAAYLCGPRQDDPLLAYYAIGRNNNIKNIRVRYKDYLSNPVPLARSTGGSNVYQSRDFRVETPAANAINVDAIPTLRAFLQIEGRRYVVDDCRLDGPTTNGINRQMTAFTQIMEPPVNAAPRRSAAPAKSSRSSAKSSARGKKRAASARSASRRSAPKKAAPAPRKSSGRKKGR